MTKNYRRHLDDRKRQTLIMNGAVLNSALSHSLLQIVFLDTSEGIAAFGDALASYRSPVAERSYGHTGTQSRT